VIGILEKHTVFLSSVFSSKRPMSYLNATPPGEKCGLVSNELQIAAVVERIETITVQIKISIA
jgi:hypothetical protein